MDIRGKKINFLGDSITEGVGTKGEGKIYWELLAEREDCICRGYGIGGTCIARQQVPRKYERHNLYFRSRVAEMDPDADIIVVFGGTNDYGHGDAALGRMSDRTDDTFYGALHNLFIDLINKYPKAALVVMTPLHRREEEEYYNEDGLRNVGFLKDYVEIIREVAEYYAIPVLDLFKCGGMQPANVVNEENFMPDALHPSNEGHEVLYRKLSAFLKTI